MERPKTPTWGGYEEAKIHSMDAENTLPETNISPENEWLED